MLDVFLDMTNVGQSTLGAADGKRCATGSALWTIGIPHDRLMGKPRIYLLSEQDRRLCSETLPMLPMYEHDIAGWHDCMVGSIRHPDLFDDAYEEAMSLMEYGRLAGINFIIASPLPKKVSSPAEPVHV